MKDAFGKTLEVGDKVIYSVGSGGGTEYVIGEISKLYPVKPSQKQYYPPDRVAVKIGKSSRELDLRTKDPILYSENVVKCEGL